MKKVTITIYMNDAIEEASVQEVAMRCIVNGIKSVRNILGDNVDIKYTDFTCDNTVAHLEAEFKSLRP
jgi:hypothetical protein